MGKQALDFKRGATYKIPPSMPLIVGIDTKHKQGEHPLWDPRAFWDLNPETIESMAEHGVLTCPLVRKDGEEIEVVDGNRRILHARAAAAEFKKRHGVELLVECRMVKGSDKQLQLIKVLANEMREDKGPMDKAELLRSMHFDAKHELSDLTVVFGRDEKTLGLWLKVFDCCKEVHDAFDADLISITAIADLSDLGRDKQLELLGTLTAGGKKATVKKTMAAVAEAKGKRSTASRPPAKTTNIVREKAKEYGLDPLVTKVVAWMQGRSDGSDIKGLKKLLSDIEEKKI